MDHRISAPLPDDDRPEPSFGPVAGRTAARGSARLLRPARDAQPIRETQPVRDMHSEPTLLKRATVRPPGPELRAEERGAVASVFTTGDEEAEGRGLLRNAGAGLLVLLAGLGVFSLIHMLRGVHLPF